MGIRLRSSFVLVISILSSIYAFGNIRDHLTPGHSGSSFEQSRDINFVNLPNVNQIPPGYIAPGEGTRYGAYTTPVQEGSRPLQNRLIDLENKAYGLALISETPLTSQAELIYLLEAETLRLHRDISAAPQDSLSPFERESMLLGSIRTYQGIRHHAERLYENMLRLIDIQIPGPNGPQIRKEIKDSAEALYFANFRTDKEISENERKKLYRDKVTSFLEKGGNLAEIKQLDSKLIQSLGEYTWFEYAYFGDGKANVTEGKAGHVLLSKGRPVKGAGQIVFLKNSAGEITLLIVTNASGNFKPDMLGASQLAKDIAKKYKISGEKIILTKGEPFSTQTLKILLKGEKTDPTVLDRKVKLIEGLGKNIFDRSKSPIEICGSVFNI